MAKGSDNPFPSVLLVEQGSAPANPASGNQRFYIPTSDHIPRVVNSSGTVSVVGGGGSGAMTHLAENIVTGSVAANIDFSGISGSYRSLVLHIMARGDNASSLTGLQIQLNADTGTNYDYQRTDFYSASGTVDAFEGVATASMVPASFTANSGPANVATPIVLTFADYARTAWQKAVIASYSVKNGTVTSSFLPGIGGGWWHNTAAITEIKLIPVAGNFQIGTVATLFGIL